MGSALRSFITLALITPSLWATTHEPNRITVCLCGLITARANAYHMPLYKGFLALQETISGGVSLDTESKAVFSWR